MMTFTLIQVPPVITPFGFGDKAQTEGDFIQLPCVVKSDSEVNIYWTYHGADASKTAEGVSIMKTSPQSSLLTIANLKKINSGQYTCTAQGPANLTVNHTVELIVHSGYHFKFLECLQSARVDIGHNISLRVMLPSPISLCSAPPNRSPVYFRRSKVCWRSCSDFLRC
jgi:hypothetical protein